MTVAELITALGQFDPNAPVKVFDDLDLEYEITDFGFIAKEVDEEEVYEAFVAIDVAFVEGIGQVRE